MLKPSEVHLPNSKSSSGVETLEIITYLTNSAFNKIKIHKVSLNLNKKEKDLVDNV
jgi:hypothetical protein